MEMPVGHSDEIVADDGSGRMICEFPYGLDADSAFIVSAVNAHDELVAALRDVLRIATAASNGITGNQPRLERARVALAKAEGGAA
jgi:hypothetical protein